jgi:transposase, IS5 family
MVVADKGYCVKPAQDTMKEKGCHSGAIVKENMRNKNRDKDRFLTRIRMPYEGVFSKMDKKARYKGIAKNQFQALMQAFAYNLKRLTKIAAPPLIFD